MTYNEVNALLAKILAITLPCLLGLLGAIKLTLRIVRRAKNKRKEKEK